MRGDRAFPRRMSCGGEVGKLNSVGLTGASSTGGARTPVFARDETVFVRKLGGVSAVARDCCCVSGYFNGKLCVFRIDTGSDVSVVSAKIAASFDQERIISCNLKYPTGEKVPIISRVSATISLGEFCINLPCFVAEICDECILGLDFLSQTGILNGLFESALGLTGSRVEKRGQICSRIEDCPARLSEPLRRIFEESSRGLEFSQKQMFLNFLNEYSHVFSEKVVAGNCNILSHCIKLCDSRPIKQVPRRIPLHLQEEVNKILEDMKVQKVIEESNSPWVSPAVMVKKKDGTIRFCVDFRKLNAVTIKDSFPLPRIDNILDCLKGNSWFCTIDLKSGYWQVSLDPKDREKTAFSVGNGLWQFTVMPFGLCNAPATFERLMEKVLKGLISKVCFVYLDDVIVFGKNFEEMLCNLKEVFCRLKNANLKVNPSKCNFLKKEVKYLGHVISAEGVATDPEKISSVRDWPLPKNRKQVRSFLGFCSYYRKFVKGFAIVAKPLYNLTEENRKFLWSSECQVAFENLKRVLTCPPILSFPSGEGQFILDTDASNHGIGAVLSQFQEGEEKVIAYFSRIFNKAERNYCVTRRELLAVVDSVKFFHHYLYGRKFLVRTDHVSLRWLMSFRNLEGQLARWMERLQQYDFDVLYHRGKVHNNADGLSRRPCLETLCRYCIKVESNEESSKEEIFGRLVFSNENFQEWRAAQLQDAVVSKIIHFKEAGTRPDWQEIASGDPSLKIYWSYWDTLLLIDGVLHKKWISPNLQRNIFQIVVPRQRIHEILKEAHDSPSGGHFGVNKTLQKVRKRFYWVSSKRDVENWCASCKECVAKKGPLGKGKSPMEIYNVGAPFERIQVDILGPLPTSSSGNKYLLVVVDCFSKWPEAVPLKNKRASTVARSLVDQVFSRHGIPLELHTDQGRNFECHLFKEMTLLLGIRKSRTTPLHPQSDGQVERQHRSILNYLAKFISENQKDWDRWISLYLLAYRSSKQEAIGMSPAEMYLGQDLRLPLDLLRGVSPSTKEEKDSAGFVSKLRQRLDSIHHFARQRLSISSKNAKFWYDQRARRKNFEPGQQVWFYNPRRIPGRAPKLQSPWEGPWEVIRKISEVLYCIQKCPRSKNKIVHANRLAPYVERRGETT